MRQRKSFALLAALLAVVLLLAAAGCGGGEASYKDKAGDIHKDVGTKLSDIQSEMVGLSIDQPGDLETFTGLIGDAIEAMDSGLTELEEIDPAPEVASLHEELVTFYDESLVTLETLERVLEYTVAAAPVMLELQDLALARLSDTAGLPEIAAAASADQQMVAAGIRELATFQVPPELAQVSYDLITVLSELESLLSQLVIAANSGDAARLVALSEDPAIGQLDTDLTGIGTDFQAIFDELALELDAMGERGAELEEDIDNL